MTEFETNLEKKCLNENLEDNFSKNFNLNEYELLEGDDEQTDEDGQTKCTQRRRRRSSGRSKNIKNLQTNTSVNKKENSCKTTSENDENLVSDDNLQKSTSSLSSWIHLPEQNKKNISFKSKVEINRNLNSSYDTISEEEHQLKQMKKNIRSIDDDLPLDQNEDEDYENSKIKSKINKINKPNKSTKTNEKFFTHSSSLSSSPNQNSYYESSYNSSPSHNELIKKENKINEQLNEKKEENIENQSRENEEKKLKEKNDLNLSNSEEKNVLNSNLINNNFNYKRNIINKKPNFLNFNHKNHTCFNHFNHNYSTNQDLEQTMPWLYNNIQRDEANKFLEKFLNVDGVFLVRTSSRNPNDYVLSFVHDRRVKHCQIKKMDIENSICFSLDDGKTKFYDLKQLIEFYQLNNYFLPTKLRYFLVHK